MENRRKFARISLNKVVRVKFKDRHQFSRYFAENLSLNGLFLRTRSDAPIGGTVHFEISADPDLPLIKGKGVIVRKDKDMNGNTRGLGIKFTSLNEESRKIIIRLIQSSQGAF